MPTIIVCDDVKPYQCVNSNETEMYATKAAKPIFHVFQGRSVNYLYEFKTLTITFEKGQEYGNCESILLPFPAPSNFLTDWLPTASH